MTDIIDFRVLVAELKTKKIEALFRFNDLLYDEEYIRNQGIDVFGMEFPDGRFPDEDQINNFLRLAFQ